MFAFCPGNIIDKVIYGNMALRGGVKALRVIHAAKMNEMLGLQPDIIDALTDETITEAVD